MGTFLVSRSRLPGLLWTRARKNANFLQERGTRKNRNANFEFLWWNKEHIREVNITVYNCMHGDQNYEYIFFYSLCCPYTVIQIAELTARGDSFVAKWLREMSDGFSRPTALLPYCLTKSRNAGTRNAKAFRNARPSLLVHMYILFQNVIPFFVVYRYEMCQLLYNFYEYRQ